MKLISGNSNRPLAEAIAGFLDRPLMEATIKFYTDHEIFVEILENVRGEDVYIIQPTSYPANDTLMELLVIADALRRGSARRICAVIPYFGYARQDRKTGPRSPISAKLVANLLTVAGIDRVLTMDLHARQIQGFFDIPVDNLFASPLFAKDIQERFSHDEVVLISPDAGGVERTRLTAEKLKVDIAIIDKRRPRAGISEVMNVIGEVEGRTCVIIDDIVDSAGTICNAADALLAKGARAVHAYASHGVLSRGGFERVMASHIKELVITDTIQASTQVMKAEKFRQLTVGPLFGEAIRSIGSNQSVSSLFL